VRFSGPEVGWALRKRTCGGRAFEAHDMPSLHAPQGPGGFLGPFTVVDVTTAVFAGQEPAQLSMPLEMAQRGGTTISGRHRGQYPDRTGYRPSSVPPRAGPMVRHNGPHRWPYFIEPTLDGGRKWSVQYERQFWA
jgi:hypothetical protein